MKYCLEEAQLICFLEGRIDSSNAPALERELSDVIAAHPGKQLVLDASELAYLSSAALRMLLRISRSLPQRLSIRNVSPEVYDVLDVTGFCQLMDVQRSMRQLDISGCQEIGRGAIGTVYLLDPDTVVKVYKSTCSLEDIQQEQ